MTLTHTPHTDTQTHHTDSHNRHTHTPTSHTRHTHSTPLTCTTHTCITQYISDTHNILHTTTCTTHITHDLSHTHCISHLHFTHIPLTRGARTPHTLTCPPSEPPPCFHAATPMSPLEGAHLQGHPPCSHVGLLPYSTPSPPSPAPTLPVP